MAGKVGTPHLTDSELAALTDLCDRLRAIIQSSDGRITAALIARQAGVSGGKLAVYVSGHRQMTRPVYARCVEWLAEFDKAFPNGLPEHEPQPVRFNAQELLDRSPMTDGPIASLDDDPYARISAEERIDFMSILERPNQ